MRTGYDYAGLNAWLSFLCSSFLELEGDPEHHLLV